MGQLTERQLECLKLAVMMTDKEIARELGLSPHTVSLHIRTAMKKLGASNRREAIRTLADNPLYASPQLSAVSKPVPDQGVSGSFPLNERRQDDDAYGLNDWRIKPAALPPVPRSIVKRFGLVMLFSVIFLIAGAVILGLMGIVVDVANEWAVDPNRT